MDAESSPKGLPNITVDYSKGSDLVGALLTSMRSKWESFSISGSSISILFVTLFNFLLLLVLVVWILFSYVFLDKMMEGLPSSLLMMIMTP